MTGLYPPFPPCKFDQFKRCSSTSESEYWFSHNILFMGYIGPNRISVDIMFMEMDHASQKDNKIYNLVIFYPISIFVNINTTLWIWYFYKALLKTAYPQNNYYCLWYATTHEHTSIGTQYIIYVIFLPGLAVTHDDMRATMMTWERQGRGCGDLLSVNIYISAWTFSLTNVLLK